MLLLHVRPSQHQDRSIDRSSHSSAALNQPTRHATINQVQPTTMTRAFRRTGSLLSALALASSSFVTGFLAPGGAAVMRRRSVDAGAATTRLFSSSSKSEEKGGGHSVPGAPQEIDPELKRIQEMLQEHQKNAPRLTAAEEARTLVYYSPGFGILGTNSQAGSPLEGFPASAMVAFAVDAQGRPLFSFSSISTHKQDLMKDPRASFAVAHRDFKGMDDGRVSFVGEIKPVPKEEAAVVREVYLQKHPGHFWVDFGDFDFFRLEDIKAVRYNGGFARFGALEPEDYLSAAPDACQAYAAPVMGHMNEDHGEATVAMVKHYIGLDVDKATIVGLDRLGMYVKVESKYGSSKLRLPFTRECTDRKVCKEIIVEMTRASAGAMEQK